MSQKLSFHVPTLSYDGLSRRIILAFIFNIFILTSHVSVYATASGIAENEDHNFEYFSEQFADLKILRYKNPDFNNLSVNQKLLSYYLAMAALSGRDIIWDQNYKHNLLVRRTLENIVNSYSGNRKSKKFSKFMIYVKRVWFSNGIHHHYSNDKIIPDFDIKYFKKLIKKSDKKNFPIAHNGHVKDLVKKIIPIIFDKNVDHKKVSQDTSEDLVKKSAVNFYEKVKQKEAENFYASIIDSNDPNPVSYGLNSKLIKKKGRIVEKTYKIGGMYDAALQKIVYWLKKAQTVCETELQKESFQKLIEYYETGDLKKFDQYNILWVEDTEPQIDAVNGFIEVYNDPLGMKGSWESVVSTKDLDSTKQFSILSDEAQWFEDHSPILLDHKRQTVSGVTYKIINVLIESGDSSPSTPIGINLPNAEWIRERHGSKSVSLGNIEEAYEEAANKSGALEEFYRPEQQVWIKKYGKLADRLSTGLHEVIGHASGRLMPGVGSPSETLKNYASPLEEARADLVALYYIGDQHLVDLGLVASTDIMKAEYEQYLTNGLIKQLARIEKGRNIEEAHMRNRQMISKWALEQSSESKVVELIKENDKTYVKINDYNKLRAMFGDLLKEVQRIKSVGDYEAGRDLIENFGVQVDKNLHEEVLKRWKKLKLAPYAGFINPHFEEIKNASGDVIDIKISYPESFENQMLYYAENFSFLPTYN